MEGYNHKDIEPKWQKTWDEQNLYKVEDAVEGKENYFTLVEFTYPSGNLHVGHWYAFAVPDIFARFKRMQGYNSLYPMGFDAFGLPAENAAIKLGKDPKTWTFEHMETMRGQLRSMGAMFDWSREVVSCTPEYYKWTQWMFTEFFKNDLAYRSNTKVNWCPKDQTILANEQVVDGKCERCGTDVVQRDQDQWMLRITKYADQLIDELDNLNWPDEIKAAQKNWIGRSLGSEIEFKIKGNDEKIKVFTTRADTLFGVTYVVLAPEHELVSKLIENISNRAEVENYITESKKKSELDRQQNKEKTGVRLEGIFAINPANNEEVSVWVADYVLAGYGTGVVMAVSAHDERDFEFAKKYNLPIKYVIEPIDINTGPGNDAYIPGIEEVERNNVVCIIEHPNDDKYLCAVWKKVNWHGFVTGGIEKDQSVEDTARQELVEETGYKNIASIKVFDTSSHSLFYHVVKKHNRFAHYRLVHVKLADLEREETSEEEKEIADFVWVDGDKVLNFLTREDMRYPWRVFRNGLDCLDTEGLLKNSGQFSNMRSIDAKQKITEFVGGKMVKTYRLRDWGISRQRYWGVPIPIVYDPQGTPHAVPKEHLPWVLPTDVDHTPDGTSPLARSKELLERTENIFGAGWRPEVETMDTFVDSSWYFYRYLDPKNEDEFCAPDKMNSWMPIDLYMGGAEHTTMHVLYSRFWTKALKDLGYVQNSEEYVIRRNRGLILGPDGNKMSKSKGNVIDPDEIVERLGADTVRMYLAFMGPYGVTVNYPWDPNGVVGIRRFLERIWKFGKKLLEQNETLFGSSGQSHQTNSSSLFSSSKNINKTIKKVGDDIAEYKFNTAISAMMICLNEFEKSEVVSKDDYKILIQLLAPFAPHLAEEIWHELGGEGSIHVSSWPKYNPELVVDDEVVVGIQINGKVRDEIAVKLDQNEQDIEKHVLSRELVKKWVGDQKIKKFIYIPGKIINIVI